MISQIRPTISNNPNVFAPFINKDGVNYAISGPFNDKSIKETKKNNEAEKEKKSNALGYSIAMTSLVAGFGVLAIMKGLPKGSRLKVDKFFKFLDTKIAKLKENKQMTALVKFKVSTLEKLKTLTDKSRGIFNVGSIKDVTFRAAINKVPFLKRFGDSITNLFEKISVKTLRNAYSKTISNLDDSCAMFSEASSILNKDQLAKINKHIKSVQKISQDTFTAKPRNIRLNEVKSDLDGLHEKVRDRFFKVKDLVKDKDTYTKFIPEELAAEAKLKLQNSVNPSVSKIKTEINEILKVYKTTLPEKEFLKMEKQANKSIGSINRSVDIETDKLFDKLRDLEIGSAPTEVLGVLTSMGVIGYGLTKADNKDERTSVALKYGIPALGAIVTSVYCTVGLVSGGASLVLGLVSGLVINKIGEAIDKSRKKYNENPIVLPSLPSLDLSKMTFDTKNKV